MRGDAAYCRIPTFYARATSGCVRLCVQYINHLLKHWSEIMAKRIDQGRAGAAQALLVDGLPPCTIQTTADGIWSVTAQLAADEQAALMASAPPPDALCQRAQHALGLAGIGSRIAPDHDAIGVYAPEFPVSPGVTPLVLDGHALLWSIARAPSESIRALITAAINVMRAVRDS